MTETMLSRLAATAEMNKQSDSSVMMQKTPTGFNSVPFPKTSSDTPREFTTVVAAPAAPAGESLAGDFASAHAGPWLSLVGEDAHRAVMLFAKMRLDMGKLREPPIDVCLRNYPLSEHRDACLRVSRRHFDVIYDPVRSAVVAVDVGSGNGTVIDGMALPANQPFTLSPDQDHNAVIAGAITLRLHCWPQRGGTITTLTGVPSGTAAGVCGIDTEHLFDVVTLTRPMNHPQKAYAMVLRRLTIGGPGADLVLDGSSSTESIEIALFAGRWLWRPSLEKGPWRPLSLMTQLVCGGIKLTARAGAFEDFG
jgi:hypothetical protein